MLQVARQIGIRISFASPASNASQISRVAEDAKHMVGTNLPNTQIRITAVVNAQTAMDAQNERIVRPCFAGLIHCPVERRCAGENE